MRRVISTAIAVLVLLLLVSCEVSPQQALQNLQNPKVKVKTSLRIPVAATDVAVGKMVKDAIEEEIPWIEVIDGTPMKLRFEKSYDIYSVEGENLLDDVKGEIPLSFEFNANTSGISLEETLDISMPNPRPYEESADVVIPNGTSKIPPDSATDVKIDLGVTSDDLEAFAVSGKLVVSISDPWDDVTVDRIWIEIKDGNGNVVVSGDWYTAEDGEVSVDLTGKRFETGNGEMVVSYQLEVSNSGETKSGKITLSIDPVISVKSLEGVKLNVSKDLDLPEDFEYLEFTAGKFVVEVSGLEFTGVSGSVSDGSTTRSFEVDDGKISVNLSGLKLPLSVSIDSVSASVTGSGPFTMEGRPSGALANMKVHVEGLEKEDTYDVPLPDSAKIVKEIEMAGGELKLQYDSRIPVDIKVLIESSNIVDEDGNPLKVEKVIEGNESSEIVLVDLTNRRMVLGGEEFSIRYSASPMGYSGDTLELKDVNLDETDFSFSATLVYGDFSVRSLTIGGTSIRYDDSLDTSDMDFLRVLPKLDLTGTITTTFDVSGTLRATLTAFYPDGSTVVKTPVAEFEAGTADLGNFIEDVKEIFERGIPEKLEYSFELSMDEVKIDFQEEKDLMVSIEFEAPMKLTLDSSVLVHEDATTIQQDLKGAEITAATLTVNATNTTGLNATVEFWSDGNLLGKITLSEGGKISLDEEDFSKIAGSGMPLVYRIYMDEGDQSLNGEGVLEIEAGIEADVLVSVGGGER